MTPEQFSDKIRDCIIATREEPWGYMADQVLRIVLAEIEKGEVVVIGLYDYADIATDEAPEYVIKLKPDFANFLAERE